jgi:hypothetical protein
MDRDSQQISQAIDRRVYTEGPSGIDDGDNMGEGSYYEEISHERLQKLMKNPKFAALFSQGIDKFH